MEMQVENEGAFLNARLKSVFLIKFVNPAIYLSFYFQIDF